MPHFNSGGEVREADHIKGKSKNYFVGRSFLVRALPDNWIIAPGL
jgi:hypothetical protein